MTDPRDAPTATDAGAPGKYGSQLQRLLAMAGELKPLRTAVVHARDAVSLGGAASSRASGKERQRNNE